MKKEKIAFKNLEKVKRIIMTPKGEIEDTERYYLQEPEAYRLLEFTNSNLFLFDDDIKKLDIVVSIISGVIAAFYNQVFTSKYSLEDAHEWGTDMVNDFVISTAQKCGYSGDNLEGAIRCLEDNYPIAADKAKNEAGGPLQHHLRDFSHHFSAVGLVFSLITQFTEKVYYTDTAGDLQFKEIEDTDIIGKSFCEKVSLGVVQWFYHMASDMAGSRDSAGRRADGTGIPGPILSTVKSLSALPIFDSRNEKGYKELSVKTSKLFNGTLIGTKFDLRTEIGLLKLGFKKSVPVLINECVIRAYVFIRKLIEELHERDENETEKINWNKVVPKNTNLLNTMLNISLMTMVLLDFPIRLLEELNKQKDDDGLVKVFKKALVRTNYITVSRFTISIARTIDTKFGIRKLRKQRFMIEDYLKYKNYKLCYSNKGEFILEFGNGEEKKIRRPIIVLEKRKDN